MKKCMYLCPKESIAVIVKSHLPYRENIDTTSNLLSCSQMPALNDSACSQIYYFPFNYNLIEVW